MHPSMELEFAGEIIHWRGPSPFHFVPVPEDESELIRDVAKLVTYGWGVIPVRARIGVTAYTTSLFPKQGGYLVPVKDAVRRAESLAVGDEVVVRLTIDMSKV
ncbi:MAG: DUF1905 domain-containing protein [Acidimicrobiales bacterium]|nr:DUF1905 domain-containing protein [Acidimicrobiales bacterium]